MPNRSPAAYRRGPFLKDIAFLVLALLACVPAAAAPPIIDSFNANPATPVPGQIVTLTLEAHDPDCATTCSSGCGVSIRADLFSWSDDTGRTGQFANSTTSPTGSPFTATVEWTAPSADGTYTVSANVADSGGFMCGGRQTTTASLTIAVSSVQPPVIDSFTVVPSTVNAGGTASLIASAHDSEGRPLTYSFTADAGTIDHLSPETPTASWTAPSAAGNVTISCTVAAEGAPAVSKSVGVTVTIGEYRGTVTLNPYTATRLEPLPDGRIAMVDGTAGVLAVGSRDGSVSWSRKGLQQPAAVAFLEDHLYVLERRSSIISIWALTGNRVGALAIRASMPNDLTADPYRRELALSDSNAGVVTIIDPASGATRSLIGSGTLLAPTGLWYENGVLGVADSAQNRVFVFDSNGTLQSTIGDDTLFVRPQGISRDVLNSNWIVSDSFSGEIHIIADDGTVLGTLGGYAGTGDVRNPLDSAFLIAGREIAVPTRTDGVKFFGLTSTLPQPQSSGAVDVVDRLGDDGEALVVTWALSPDDPVRVTRYHIERDDDGNGSFVRVGEVPSGTTTWTDLNAGDGRCHSYRIVASDGVMEATSTVSNCVVAINDRPPDVPVFLTAVATSPFDAVIEWSAVPAGDLASYLLEITGADGTSSVSYGPIITQAIFDSLTPGQQYSLTLWAYDTAGNASAPAQKTLITYPDDAPPAPRSIVANDTGMGGQVIANWTMPESTVPIERYLVRYEPAVEGWPAFESTVVDPEDVRAGLVNQLQYIVRVTAFTPWGREGESAASDFVVPTAPNRIIPILQRAGREGTSGLEDSAGIGVITPFTGDSRVLRFVYRTVGTSVLVEWNGAELPETLPDTDGEWVEIALTLDRTASPDTTTNLVRMINPAFPAYNAEVAFDRVDLVPLNAADTSTTGYDTVIDIEVLRAEAREDLGLVVQRSETPARIRPVIPGDRQTYWMDVDCRNPFGNVCRDAFRADTSHYSYRVGIRSPAGWLSGWEAAQGQTHPPYVPPPVTDLSVTPLGNGAVDGYRLDWTPISYFDSATGEPKAIPEYRLVVTDGTQRFDLATVAAPPFDVAPGSLPDGFWFKLYSVDDMGRESE